VVSAGPGDHAVAFYQENELAVLVGGYLQPAVSGGGAAVVMATPEHRFAVDAWLAAAGIDLPAAWADGSYVPLDAGQIITRFTTNGRPDPARFWETVSPVLGAVSRKRGPVRVFSEMAGVLWATDLVDSTLELEALWNEIAGQYPFSSLCCYPAAALGDAAYNDSLAQVCCAHSAVLGAPPGSGEDWLPGWSLTPADQ
jgi:MEDS: MEthanogen/methylotroph, DcmR Sensory domain